MTTNREKALNGEAVQVTDGRLREMQRIAVANEGAGECLYHWHWVAVVNELIERRAEVSRLQARIDALMLEYCPGEMTPEQTAEWARHQAPHQLSAEEREALERAPAADETPTSPPAPCINWPCQLSSGHSGPCSSYPESEDAR